MVCMCAWELWNSTCIHTYTCIQLLRTEPLVHSVSLLPTYHLLPTFSLPLLPSMFFFSLPLLSLLSQSYFPRPTFLSIHYLLPTLYYAIKLFKDGGDPRWMEHNASHACYACSMLLPATATAPLLPFSAYYLAEKGTNKCLPSPAYTYHLPTYHSTTIHSHFLLLYHLSSSPCTLLPCLP